MHLEFIQTVLKRMSEHIDGKNLMILNDIMQSTMVELFGPTDNKELTDSELIDSFLAAKQVEGCSEKTIKYYTATLKKVVKTIGIPVKFVTTDDVRRYLSDYQSKNNVGKVTLDNVRRILSSFYSWMEDESHILKSPIRRIKKVKVGKVVKDVYADESIELMRDNCRSLRDLAMIDILSSTGMRVGELVNLDRDDIDFQNRECVVLGKGDKERLVYFDARTKVHLHNYLESRTDSDPALFVTLNEPHERLKISGVEKRLRELGRRLGLGRVHPHKFRRTLATKAIDKGMPIEQVQKLLGHQKIDTTLEYAMVNQNNVKISHRKYIG